MADELPPLEAFPEDSSPSSSSLRRSAEWASTFGGNNTTNLAQRQRHNRDILAYTEARQREEAARQANELATNKTAQDLW